MQRENAPSPGDPVQVKRRKRHRYEDDPGGGNGSGAMSYSTAASRRPEGILLDLPVTTYMFQDSRSWFRGAIGSAHGRPLLKASEGARAGHGRDFSAHRRAPADLGLCLDGSVLLRDRAAVRLAALRRVYGCDS